VVDVALGLKRVVVGQNVRPAGRAQPDPVGAAERMPAGVQELDPSLTAAPRVDFGSI
jgi:hypothetical protein